MLKSTKAPWSVTTTRPSASSSWTHTYEQTHEERGATAQQCLSKRCSKAYQACIHRKGLVGCCHSYNSRSAPLLSTAPPERGAAARQLHQAQRQYRRRECRLRAASTIAGATSEWLAAEVRSEQFRRGEASRAAAAAAAGNSNTPAAAAAAASAAQPVKPSSAANGSAVAVRTYVTVPL